eukprot:16046338-Heterocapsa_arctica.AAC.1
MNYTLQQTTTQLEGNTSFGLQSFYSGGVIPVSPTAFLDWRSRYRMSGATRSQRKRRWPVRGVLRRAEAT